MNEAFHDRVRAGFHAIAKAEPERCVVIDANNEPAEVAERIWRALQDRLPTCVSVGAGA